MNDIKQITTQELPKVVKMCIKAGLIPCVVSQPGVGKSQIVEQGVGHQLAEEANRKFVIPKSHLDWNINNYCFSTIVASQLSESDTLGVPVLKEYDGESVTEFSLSALIPFNKDAKGFLFFDEWTNAKEHIQAALQSILTSRRIGNRKIPDGVHIVMAGNKTEDGANEPTNALKNRVLWFELAPLPRLEKYYDEMAKIGRPIDVRLHAGDKAGIISQHLDNYNAEDYTQYCYGSRRMYEYVSNGIKDLNDLDDIELIVAGGLGATCGAKFKQFLKLSLNVDIPDILKNPEKINTFEQNGGLLYSICAAIVDRTVNKKEKVQATIRVANALELSEYSMFMLLALKNKIGLKNLITTLKDIPEGKEVLTKMVNIVKEVENN